MNTNSCAVQAITDMVIANESRVAKSRVVTTFNKARQVLINIAIRWLFVYNKVLGIIYTIFNGSHILECMLSELACINAADTLCVLFKYFN